MHKDCEAVSCLRKVEAEWKKVRKAITKALLEVTPVGWVDSPSGTTFLLKDQEALVTLLTQLKKLPKGLSLVATILRHYIENLEFSGEVRLLDLNEELAKQGMVLAVLWDDAGRRKMAEGMKPQPTVLMLTTLEKYNEVNAVFPPTTEQAK